MAQLDAAADLFSRLAVDFSAQKVLVRRLISFLRPSPWRSYMHAQEKIRILQQKARVSLVDGNTKSGSDDDGGLLGQKTRLIERDGVSASSPPDAGASTPPAGQRLRPSPGRAEPVVPLPLRDGHAAQEYHPHVIEYLRALPAHLVEGVNTATLPPPPAAAAAPMPSPALSDSAQWTASSSGPGPLEGGHTGEAYVATYGHPQPQTPYGAYPYQQQQQQQALGHYLQPQHHGHNGQQAHNGHQEHNGHYQQNGHQQQHHMQHHSQPQPQQSQAEPIVPYHAGYGPPPQQPGPYAHFDQAQHAQEHQMHQHTHVHQQQVPAGVQHYGAQAPQEWTALMSQLYGTG
jgi:hypothetical protein